MSRSLWFIWKKGFKTLTKNKAKTIPIIILMAATIGLGASIFDMIDARGRMVEQVLEDTNFADGFIYFDPAPQSNVTALMQNISSQYFKDYEFRMAILIKFEIDGKGYDGLLMGIDMSRNSHINALIDEESKEIDEYDFCLHWNFAEEHNIEQGDKITLSMGSIKMKEKIRNIGFNSEFIFSSLYDNVAFPSIKPFPVFYVDIDYVNQFFINQSIVLVNQILYKLKDDVKQEVVEDKVEEYIGEYIHDIVSQDDYPFVKVSREDQENDRQFFMIYVAIFIIGSVITLIIVINKLIENDLKSVSVFQGLGAYKGEIIAGYLIMSIILVAISLFIGCFLNFFTNIPINLLVEDALGIPNSNVIYFSIYNNLMLAGLILCVSLVATYIFSKKAFHMDVQKSLKHEYEFAEKPNIVERLVSSFRKNFHPFSKYNIRRIFGRKLYIFFIFLGLSMSFCIIMLSYGYPDSLQFSVDKKLDEIEQWDAMATTWNYESESVIKDMFENISDIEDFEIGISDNILMSKKNSNFENNMRILAYESNSKLHLLNAENDVKLEDNNEVLVSKDVLIEYDVEIGDKFYIKNIASNISFQVKIIGSVNDMTMDTIFMTIKGAQIILETPNFVNIIYFTIKDNVKDTMNQVQDLPQIESVVEKEALREEFQQFVETFLVLFLIIGFILTIFGLALIAIILKAIIEYRMEDYGNMKALGLHDSEIQKSFLKEVVFYLLISLPLGLMLGIIITTLMVEYYSFILPGFFFHLYPISYFYFSLNVFLIISVGFLLQIRKIRRMNISEITKMKTFG